MMRLVLSPVLLLVLGLPEAPPVAACQCARVAPFAEQARIATVLLAGRVVGGLATRARDAAAIDLDVVQVLRGREARLRIRVWDQTAGTSCSLGMKRFRPHALIVIALDPHEVRPSRLSELSHIPPKADDYVLGACRQPWRLFSTQAKLDAYIASGAWR